MEYILASLINIFLAFIGTLIAGYIFVKKNNGHAMVCPMNMHCEPVLTSEYARTFGIPNELMGIAYYSFIALWYAMTLLFTSLVTETTMLLTVIVSGGAFLFSTYLIGIQAFVLKNWCSWCIISAALSTAIFFVTLLSLPFPLAPILVRYEFLFVLMHLIAVGLGVGGATIGDILFFKFLKDFRISRFEADVLRTLSQIIWTALGIFFISGAAIYLTDMAKYNESSKFLVKMFIVLVITINGFFLNLVIAPKLMKISFHKKHDHKARELAKYRKLAFSLGAISLTSWYTALILGSMHQIPFDVETGILAYLLILLMAVSISQILEHRFSNQRKAEH
ncbi:MAG: vitamin K epoxide reductase family protein [Parcubacteria group bacterium]|nr:vitamin K epoxide reductase family protein [Parcubacteria group bacterium]